MKYVTKQDSYTHNIAHNGLIEPEMIVTSVLTIWLILRRLTN